MDWSHFEGEVMKDDWTYTGPGLTGPYWDGLHKLDPWLPSIPPSIPFPDKDLIEEYKKFLEEMEEKEKESKKKIPEKPPKFVPVYPKPKPKPKKKRKPRAKKVEPPPAHDDTIEEREV